MSEEKKLVSPGSLLNSSEGLLSGGAMAALVQQATSTDDWRVACAACVGIAIIGATYTVMRQKAKIAEAGGYE